PARASEQIIAVNFKPYVGDEGDGPTYRIVVEAARRIGADTDISVYPFGRALEIAKSEPAVVFPLLRSQEREQLLDFGPIIYRDNFAFFVRRGERRRYNSLDSLKTASICLIQRSILEDFLRSAGFSSFERVSDDLTAARMLNGGRVDVWYTTQEVARASQRAAGLPMGTFEAAVSTGERPLFLTFSKLLNPDRARAWTAAIESMAADGTLDRLAATE
ncbi:MAG: transporter substrate-binding domain-containing protein, partial [Hyphomicrobiales bacterium]|nr:transporter substrate-binding domain-containing protein [Hyphomicrobiales bacterium]